MDTVFPPTGRPFAVTQSHWFLLEDGRIIDHWANRLQSNLISPGQRACASRLLLRGEPEDA